MVNRQQESGAFRGQQLVDGVPHDGAGLLLGLRGDAASQRPGALGGLVGLVDLLHDVLSDLDLLQGLVGLGAADDPAATLKRAFESAKSAVASGDLTEAERHYDEAITLSLRQLANLSVSESRFDEAAGELDQALKFVPGDSEITSEAAIAWFRAGDVKKARELIETVVAANPRHARALSILGRINL